ncbi:MAG: restriction endonuclease [Thermoanaerobaculia bacterium]
MGYGGSRAEAGEAIGRAGDEGIDGVINEDRLGLNTIYIQAKKWEGPVSRPEIQKFVGALQGKRARKGVFNTPQITPAICCSLRLQFSGRTTLASGVQNVVSRRDRRLEGNDDMRKDAEVFAEEALHLDRELLGCRCVKHAAVEENRVGKAHGIRDVIDPKLTAQIRPESSFVEFDRHPTRKQG